MTTIVYRDGVMAGDGRETTCTEDESYYIVRDNCVKVYRLKNGNLFGAAHASEACQRLYDALKQGHPPPKLDDVAGLMVDRKRRIWLYEGNIWQRVNIKFYAVGSGAIMAFPLLDAGADAITACRIAAERDPFSGGRFSSVRLHRR